MTYGGNVITGGSGICVRDFTGKLADYLGGLLARLLLLLFGYLSYSPLRALPWNRTDMALSETVRMSTKVAIIVFVLRGGCLSAVLSCLQYKP